MTEFIITFRKLYWIEILTKKIEAYSFADAEEKFNLDQEEDNLIIVKIERA